MAPKSPEGPFFGWGPRDLFLKFKQDVDRFFDSNSREDLFNALTAAYHLAEWIQKHDGDRGQEFRERLVAETSYPTVEKLCNAGKHGIVKIRTQTISEPQVGLLRVGEPLGGFDYFLVGGEGTDVRDVILELVREYNAYFEYEDGQEE